MSASTSERSTFANCHRCMQWRPKHAEARAMIPNLAAWHCPTSKDQHDVQLFLAPTKPRLDAWEPAPPWLAEASSEAPSWPMLGLLDFCKCLILLGSRCFRTAPYMKVGQGLLDKLHGRQLGLYSSSSTGPLPHVLGFSRPCGSVTDG